MQILKKAIKVDFLAAAGAFGWAVAAQHVESLHNIVSWEAAAAFGLAAAGRWYLSVRGAESSSSK